MAATNTTTTADPNTGNLHDVTYARFRERVAQRLECSAREAGALFTTDADLWPIYLGSFPEGPTRQHHNCNTCRYFIGHFGGLATIGPHGEVSSALWREEDADAEHEAAVSGMARAVRRASITGVFLYGTSQLGRRVTVTLPREHVLSVPIGSAIQSGLPTTLMASGAMQIGSGKQVWAHLAADTPPCSLHRRTDVTPGQAAAKKRQDHANVMRALEEFPLDLLRQVVDLLKADALYRSEKVLGPARWLAELAESVTRGDRQNLVWRAVATAPSGFCHPRSSMVGSLLEDLAGGSSFEEAARKFQQKMDPGVYQRPQAPPSSGAIEAAERLVDKLGIARSLPRRFARIDEIQTLWRPAAAAPPPAADRSSVFAHLEPKAARSSQAVQPINTPAQPITWEKFARSALPDAKQIEVYVPAMGNFGAAVTAVHEDAPPILQWDRADRRNPVSWYVYRGGSPAGRWGLVAGAFARVEAVTLQPSMWFEAAAHHGRAAMFIIDGAMDAMYANSGGALFPEILRADLHSVRSVIEAYSRTATLAGADQASACGIVVSDGSEVTVRLTSKAGSKIGYKIDRWD